MADYIDPITCEYIQEEDRVFLGDVCVSIHTLYSNYLASGKTEDPFTRKELPKDVKQRLLLMVQEKEVCILYCGKAYKYPPSCVLGEALKQLLYYDEFYTGEDVLCKDTSLFDADFTITLEMLSDNHCEFRQGAHLPSDKLRNFTKYLGTVDDGMAGALQQRLHLITLALIENEVVSELEMTVDRKTFDAHDYYYSIFEQRVHPSNALDFACMLCNYKLLLRVLWFNKGLRCSFKSVLYLSSVSLKNELLIRNRDRILNSVNF